MTLATETDRGRRDDDPADRDWIPDSWSDAARAIPGAFRFGEGVKPWNWLELDAEEAERLWSLLFSFVAYFNRRYGERVDRRIPPCWAEHGPVVEELTTLMFARWHAFESAEGSVGGAQYWHSYTLPAFYERVRSWLGDGFLRCQQGWHGDLNAQELESAISWMRRNELISTLDLKQRERRECDSEPQRCNPSTGVEIPYLGKVPDLRRVTQAIPKN